jgi:hypothetical protein
VIDHVFLSIFEGFLTRTTLRKKIQIGRIFARWVTANFGRLFENDKSSQHFRPTFLHGEGYVGRNFDKKLVGQHFGRFFSKTHLVTLKKSPLWRFNQCGQMSLQKGRPKCGPAYVLSKLILDVYCVWKNVAKHSLYVLQ